MQTTVFHTLLILSAILLPGAIRGEESIPPNAEIINESTEAGSISTLRMSLDEVIMRARANSVEAAAALDRLRTAWWEYRSYRADLLPEITFSATAPGYYKQYSAYMNQDGNYSFVPNNYLQMTGGVTMTQKIWPTGGEISLSTSLDFMRQYGPGAYNRFMSVPVALTLRQPVFGVNDVKWNRRIEPVKYREAKAAFLSQTENVAILAIDHYFRLIMARENRSIARQNLENAARLYDVAVEKREMGRISGNDLLQMELNLLSARSAMTDTESELRSCMFALRSFLDIDEDVDIEPIIPTEMPEAEVTYASALEKALTNNSHLASLKRRRLEAEYNVARAKGDMRSITLLAQVGYTGTDKQINGAYSDLQDNQLARIGFEIPILDWGKRKGKVKVAESNLRVVESTLREENRQFEQNLFILVERYGNQRSQLDISRRADEIAARRYETNVETFMIGKISTLDLNDSRVNKDEARRDYVNQLYLYWSYYYQLRGITLWDYARNEEIDVDFTSILK